MDQTFTPDSLFAGQVMPVVTGPVTVAAGNRLTRGTVLGQVTATGACVAVDSAATDGSEAPYAVLAQDVDATAQDTAAAAYLTGEFNQDALIFGGADTLATHKAALRRLAIFAKPVLG